MSAELERLVASLHEVAAADRERVRVAPFTAFVDPLRTTKYLSFAIPQSGAGPEALAAALPALEQAFAERGRTPRIEHLEELCPALGEVVEGAGWTLSERLPVMVCTPATLNEPPRPDGLSVQRIDPGAPEELTRAMIETQRAAFGDTEPLAPEHVARNRERAAREFQFAGLLGGRLVAAAVATPIARGVSEVVGVATAPEHRRRGIGGTLTAAAARAAFAAGAEVAWLSAADGAEGIYARAGFSHAATQCGHDRPGGVAI